MQAGDHADDEVVGAGNGEIGRQRLCDGLGLQEQQAGGRVGCVALQRHSLLDGCRTATHDLFDEAACLAGIAIEFLQRLHRQEDVMFLEPEETRRVVQQDVGVEYEEPLLAAALAGATAGFTNRWATCGHGI